MNSQDFLTLNLVGAGAFIFWYLVSRGGPRRPTKLNMKASDSAPPLMDEPKMPVKASYAKERSYTSSNSGSNKGFNTELKPKTLNVMFNYNGHSWDAYEVLGVPAGSSMKTVTEAYQSAIRKCEKDSIEFLETAYNSILHKH